MFDIKFYMKSYDLNIQLEQGQILSSDFVEKKYEAYRNEVPVIYNIETTNACNMKCAMCPRTTMMTRSVETIKMETFSNIVKQLKPFTQEEWATWKNFIVDTYNILDSDMSENHFFLYIIPKVIQLHGYGDPLLDKNMGSYVQLLTEKNIPSYFSCNPANISMDITVEMFKSGLDYIKYSIESVEDEEHKTIRGNASNFASSYEKILKLLEIKQKNNYKTTIIITMLDLNRDKQADDYRRLKEAFEGLDVYIYLKSEDQQWYRKDYHGTNSIHWSEVCKHPWMSMTIKSNGEAAMCMEDYNNEIILGDSNKESLFDIWNGDNYSKFRKQHLLRSNEIKCTNECDMKLIGDFFH